MLSNFFKKLRNLPVWIRIGFISISVLVVFLPFQFDLYKAPTIKKLYYVDHMSEAHYKIINSFNEKHKGKIEVIPVNLPFQNFTTNNRKAILTRSLRNRSDALDIFSVDFIWVPRFTKWAANLDKLLSPSLIKNLAPTALEACYDKNQLMACPLFIDLGVLYYRQDIIRSLPDGAELEKKIQNSLTWDEFISLGKRFKNTNNPYYVFTGGNFEGMMCCYNENLTVEESNNIFYSKPIDLTTDASKKSLSLLHNLIYKYKYSPPEVTEFNEFSSYIYATQNNAVFLRGWLAYHKQYRNYVEDKSLLDKMKIAPMPHFEGNNTSATYGGWCLMINKFSIRKKEAAMFINFMLLPENQKLLYKDGGYMPVNNQVGEDSSFVQEFPNWETKTEMLKWGKHRPFLKNYTRISEILANSFHKAISNEVSVEEALEDATEKVNSERTLFKLER